MDNATKGVIEELSRSAEVPDWVHAEELRQELGGVGPKGYTYWDVVASSAIVRSRSFGTISGMEEAGITEYEVLAMGDERMCDICGALNGTVSSVAETRSVINKALDITDPEEFKAAMPWHTKPPVGKSAAELTRNGQNLPPFHGRCRCTLVMTSEGADPDTLIMQMVKDGVTTEQDAIKLGGLVYKQAENEMQFLDLKPQRGVMDVLRKYRSFGGVSPRYMDYTDPKVSVSKKARGIINEALQSYPSEWLGEAFRRQLYAKLDKRTRAFFHQTYSKQSRLTGDIVSGNFIHLGDGNPLTA